MEGFWFILHEPFFRPGCLVFNPLTWRLQGAPQFQVLRPVVVLYPVGVMYVLAGKKGASQNTFHNEHMLKHPYALAFCGLPVPADVTLVSVTPYRQSRHACMIAETSS